MLWFFEFSPPSMKPKSNGDHTIRNITKNKADLTPNAEPCPAVLFLLSLFADLIMDEINLKIYITTKTIPIMLANGNSMGADVLMMLYDKNNGIAVTR